MEQSVRSAVEELKKTLGSQSRLVVVGVGSELRNDDIAGVLVARKLEKIIEESKLDRLRAVVGSSAPESVTGEIIKFKPTHVLIVDTAEIGSEPGQIGIIEASEIQGVSFSTHMLPLSVTVSYLKASIPGLEVFVLGIQPKNIEFGFVVSKEVTSAVEDVVMLVSGFFTGSKV
ncbi:MAG: hydrogenase maturation peptidase HycI [Bdellovibrionales bacterium RIFOXYD1_FULL_44_7]|nr:MAG: hydrogenase maturation peptidase HycI [Bdellovibrionales bacterium RIFOXYD1_FULL_44_7]